MCFAIVYSLPLPLSPLVSTARQRKGKASSTESIHLFIVEEWHVQVRSTISTQEEASKNAYIPSDSSSTG